MKLKSLAVGVLAVFGIVSHAMAGTAVGKVTKLNVREGLVYFTLSGAAVGRPGCAVNTQYFMIKDENSSVGRQQIALLLTAMSSDKLITADGANQCTKWGDGEDLRQIVITN
ncbi:hypothetical protein [Cupriavidus alkaliphilus]|uniref:Beta/gamma crystallin n=1 Tax=Cupriavidus alkaliphilus TaxID=942866 RepID=A0A7W4V750_9BURK|nr:hypothetical protein [Cupriavidus alkaliphilus]MBB3006214.1 hypothetical protein [Cupriavidus alkaliphilus]